MSMTTRRSGKQTEASKEEKREASRIELAKKNEAILPDFVDRYSDDYEDRDEPIWFGAGPPEGEMKRYLEETKNRGIRIDTAHDILFDHGMDTTTALGMIVDYDLVPVDLVSADEKSIVKALEPVVGFCPEGKKSWPIGVKMFPGHNMTTIYNEVFKQNVGLLSDCNRDIFEARQTAKKTMSQSIGKRSSTVTGKSGRESRGVSTGSSSRSSTPGPSRSSEPRSEKVPPLKLRRISATCAELIPPTYKLATPTPPSTVSIESINKMLECTANNPQLTEVHQQLQKQFEIYKQLIETKSSLPANPTEATVTQPVVETKPIFNQPEPYCSKIEQKPPTVSPLKSPVKEATEELSVEDRHNGKSPEKSLPSPVVEDDDIVILDDSPSSSQIDSGISSGANSDVEITYARVDPTMAIHRFTREVATALDRMPSRMVASILLRVVNEQRVSRPVQAVPPIQRPVKTVQPSLRQKITENVNAIRKSSRVPQKRSRYNEEEYVLHPMFRSSSRSVTPPEAKKQFQGRTM